MSQGNGYTELLGDLYDEIPKSVFAAIAVSLATGGSLEDARGEIAREWNALARNSIVPQKPSRRVQALIKPYD